MLGVADGLVLVEGGGPCPGNEIRPGLVALDAATGQEVWRSELAPDDDLAAVGLGQGVVVHGRDGIQAIDLTDGHVLWKRDGLTAGLDGPDYIVASKGDPLATFVVLDRRTGEQRWSGQFPTDIAGIAGDGAEIVVGGMDHDVGYDARSGRRLWVGPGGTAGGSPRLVGDGVVITEDQGSVPGTVRGLDAATGTERWTAPGDLPQESLSWAVAPAAGASGHAEVYVIGKDRQFEALDGRTGTLQWSFGAGSVEPLVGPGLVLQRATPFDPLSGELRAVDPTTGRTLWTRPGGLVGAGQPSPSGIAPSYVNALPTSSGVLVAYGHCLSS